jgi:hypothetical protein
MEHIVLGHEASACEEVVVDGLGFVAALAQGRVHCPELCEVSVEANVAGVHLRDDAALPTV